MTAEELKFIEGLNALSVLTSDLKRINSGETPSSNLRRLRADIGQAVGDAVAILESVRHAE